MWDKRVFEKVECAVGIILVLVFVLLRGVVDGFEWVCLGVYGPNDDSLRDLTWAELSMRAWCLFDDFNIIK